MPRTAACGDAARGQEFSSPIWAQPADFAGRANFAKNFFEAGGIEAMNDEGFELDRCFDRSLQALRRQAGLPVLIG